jgi:hypothetical protein
MQPNQHQQYTNEDSSRDHLANERSMMFLNFRLEKRVQSAVNLGHCRFLSATLIAQRASPVLLFSAKRLIDRAKLSQREYRRGLRPCERTCGDQASFAAPNGEIIINNVHGHLNELGLPPA